MRRDAVFVDVYAGGFALSVIGREVVEEAAGEGGFANAPLPNEEHFGLM